MDFKKLIAIPKSLYYNIHLFGWEGIKLPIIFSVNTRIYGLRKGKIEVEKQIARCYIGFDGVKGVEPARHTDIILGQKGKIVFKGSSFIAKGTTIRVDAGTCTFGDHFNCNTNCFISCTDQVTFGNNCLLGWNVNVRDSDGHTVILNDSRKPSLKSVFVGDNVWIAANVDILKGVSIGQGSVVGYRSCVTKPILEENCLIAGFPAKIIQSGISWEK